MPTPVLADPVGVVPLLRQRPRVALHDHRQLHRHRLADAARPRLADEIIGQLHVARHLFGEAFHEHGRLVRHRLQRLAQLLHSSRRSACNCRSGRRLAISQHHGGALSAEQHQPDGLRRVEAQLRALRRALVCRKRRDLVEARIRESCPKRDAPCPSACPMRARLLHRLRRAADEMLTCRSIQKCGG